METALDHIPMISIERFQKLVSEAVDTLPAGFRRSLRNVAILVETKPGKKLLRSLGHRKDESLFGLYQGTPLTDRGAHDPVLPDTITLFYETFLQHCKSEVEIQRQVRITVIHEIAHYLGMDEDEIEKLGYG
jgi:predicted Zn-dependent protease with MMP-like domain